MIKQLKEERFSELYGEVDDSVKSKYTRQQFRERMKEVLHVMRQINSELAFQRDKGWEETKPIEDLYCVQRISNGETTEFIVVNWSDEFFSPKFANIVITNSDYPDSKWRSDYDFKGFY